MSGINKREILEKLKRHEISADVALKLYTQIQNDESPSLAGMQSNEVSIKSEVINYLKEMVSQETKIKVERISEDDDVGNFGLDSLMILNFNDKLESDFQGISKTLFYEYKTLDEIADYIIEEYSQVVKDKFEVKIHDKNEYKEQSLKELSKKSEETFSAIDFKYENPQEKLSLINDNKDDDIAIIGISGRYPQADNLYEFWNNIKLGKDCITEIPKDRWDSSKRFTKDKDEKGKVYSKWGGFINDVDKFDSLFFNISPKEAKIMDPQERIFLENSWNTIEDAGYTKDLLKKHTVGVFVGVMYGQYQMLAAEETYKNNVMAASSFYSAIANRVSYFFDFKGPSIALDTMCSSSITSIHLACDSIRKGECDMALAGGVNLTIHENKYIYLCQEKFASSDGRCRSFGKDGDGYVPGEGVGSVLLKSLKKAEEDGDNIYAVIKGSAINHGGKSNGYSVPDPNAQANVISSAFEKSGIPLERVGYLEMHGTGTSLGDPIEIAGISKVFRNIKEDYKCPIGSVKSNIGHLESAAGIASITKVILQMKYGMITPSIHSDELNPNINFEKSHFYVERNLKKWDRYKKVQEGSLIEYPRVAGISAFGAGGSNAHIILEEYVDKRIDSNINLSSYIIPLSADTDEQIALKVKDLLEVINLNDDMKIQSIMYTLQTGRTSLSKKIAIMASSIKDLKEKLVNYINNINDKDILRNDKVPVQSEDLSIIMAKKWLQGEEINWNELYNNEFIKKISLPGYPFKKVRHWINIKDNNSEDRTEAKLHEFIHKNVSNFKEQRYISKFTGREDFFKDHKVGDKVILPAAVQIEMMRYAIEDADTFKVNKIRDIKFYNSIYNDDQEISINVMKSTDEVKCQIWSSNNDEEIIYTNCTVEDKEKEELLQENINLEDIINRLDSNMDSEKFYNNMIKNKMNYGPSFRMIKSIKWNDKEAVAEIDGEYLSSLKDVKLNPDLIDGALQAIGIFTFFDNENMSYVPYSIENITFKELLSNKCNAYVKKLSANSFDIYLTDNNGNVFCKINNLNVLPVKKQPQILEGNNIKLLSEKWIEEKNTYEDIENNNIVVAFTYDEENMEYVRQLRNDSNCEFIVVTSNKSLVLTDNERYIDYDSYDDIKKLFEDLSLEYEKITFNIIFVGTSKKAEITLKNSIYFIFNLTKGIISNRSKNKYNLICMCKKLDSENYCLYSSIECFMKVLNNESSSIKAKFIEVDDNFIDSNTLLKEFNIFTHSQVKFINGNRYISVLSESYDESSREMNIKHNGTYIITGGSGKLGLAVARYISSKNKCNIILLGRSSKLKKEVADEIQNISNEGINIEYVQCDITDINDTADKLQIIRNKYNEINGIIHSAGIIKDSFILNKDLNTFNEVIAPKVQGTFILDEVLKDDNLDFFIMFSSIATVIGNIGQGDYCYGNEFMNDFAEQRNMLVERKQRRGNTLSINWPLWENGGMEVSQTKINQIKKNTGLDWISEEEGINTFERLLLNGKGKVVVFSGDYNTFKNKFILDSKEIENTMEQPMLEVDKKLVNKIQAYIKKSIADEVELSIDEIISDENLSRLGLTSIMMMNIIKKISKKIENVPSTLFYENDTVNEIVDYLLENNYVEVINGFKELNQLDYNKAVKAFDLKKNQMVIKDISEPLEKQEDTYNDDIAIIGVSGKYPQADNLEEFWDNLLNKRDCITEVPKDRWDWRDYYNEEKGKKGFSYGKWGGFLNNIDKFDPLEFNISPKEAKLMDPQERLFLETVLECMEDAGYSRRDFTRNKVGVFVGAMYSQYQLYSSKEGGYVSSNLASIANRVSYVMNFHGPSISLDTMCSSSLTAIHLACQSIKQGDCDTAIVGGVNLAVHPNKYLLLSQGLFLSSEGKCRSFGEGGDGYVPGEGVGAVIIKSLKDAIRDKDNIYAVIKATGINHGGKTSGFTVPSGKAQSEVIKDVIKKSNINPRDINYIEAHGTGTALGDPIEIQSLRNAFKEYTSDKQFCSIGSVKSNIGHLESAAGIASLTKVLLQLKYKTILPTLYCDDTNRKIDFKNSPFKLTTEAEEWDNIIREGNVIPRTAAISAFGAGGSNAHIILQEWSNKEEVITNHYKEDATIITLSGRKKEQIARQAKSLINYLNRTNKVKIQKQINSKEIVRNVLSKILKLDLDDNCYNQEFSELGMDTRDLINLKSMLEEELNIELNIDYLSQNSTINKLSKYIENIYQLESEEVEEDKSLLYDMAYTLWNGRDKRKSRLAIVTNSISDLKNKLQRYVNGDENIEEVYFSDVDNNVLINCFNNDSDLNNVVNKWAENEEFNKIAQFWISGVEVKWDTVFKDVKARKISLPNYPLIRQSYWLEPVGKSEYTVKDEKTHLLGSMDFKESCKSEWIVFSKTIEKDDRLLKDHNVNNECILPGAASLEVILEGINYLIEDSNNNKFHIEDLKWNRPIRCINDKCELKSYFKMNNDEIIFNIKQNIDNREVINVSGKFVKADSESKIEKIYLNHYKNKLDKVITRNEVYDILSDLKLNYGESLRGIEYIHASSNEELSFIKMPEGFANYILHPAILDSAFQSIIGMKFEHYLSVPAKIDTINIINKVEKDSYVYCVKVNENKYNMYICDAKGDICVELINLTLASIENKEINKSNVKSEKEEFDFIYTSNWTEEKINAEKSESTILKSRNDILVFFTRDSESIAYSLKNLYRNKNISLIELCDKNEEISESYSKLNAFDELSIREYIKAKKEIDSIYLIASNFKEKIYDIDLNSINKAQEESILLLFRMIKQLENDGYNSKNIDINIITNNVSSIKGEEVNPYYSYLCGFGKSLSKEKNNWNVQVIDIDLFNDFDVKKSAEAIYNIPDNLLNKSISIRSDKYYTVELNKVALKENAKSESFVNKGTYVIVGGTGGIGSELSYYIAENYKANVVLIGRKKINSDINEQLSKIEVLGGRGLYIEADMCNADSMKNALNIIKGEFSVINGVIHSALVLNDRMISLMTESELRKVLNPKVNGSVVLAETFKNEKLDFIMFFSSAQAFAGSIGQSNYSAACSFKDAFAWYLKTVKNMNVRIINWGYWSEVGIVSSEEYVNSLREQGIYPIKINEGMDIISRTLQNEIVQVMPIKVDDKVLNTLGKISSNENNELQKIYELKNINDNLEQIIPYMIAVEFQKIGLFKEEHDFIEVNDLKDKINLIDKYNNLFDEILNILEQDAFIIKDDQIIITTSKVSEDLYAKVSEFKSEYINKGLEKELALLEICMKDLINILDGSKNAAQVIFSGSSVKYVEGIYTGNVLVDYFNNKVRKYIEEYLKKNVNKLRKLRILEVGAGTGGTTKALLKSLEEYGENIEYYYTDISNRFIEYGKSNFGLKYDFFKFNILNIEEDASVSNFDRHSFDIVIATNVLHATKNIDKTVSNIKELLSNNGQVVINEVTDKRSFLTMTFGLLDGWWLSEDSKRINGSPLLSKSNWNELLAENNFEVIYDVDEIEDYIGYQRVITGINKNDESDVIEAEIVSEEIDFDPIKEDRYIDIVESKIQEAEEIKFDNKSVNSQKFIEDKIIESIVESLEISKSEIDKNRAFSEYGIDSITGLDLVKKINDKFNIALKTTVIFDYPYISKLAEFINNKFKVI